MLPIDAVEQVYEMKDREAVRSFLELNPHLLYLLLEGRVMIKRLFDGPPCELELAGDPETGDVALEARIATTLTIREALERLAKFDNAWWLTNQARAKGQLVFII